MQKEYRVQVTVQHIEKGAAWAGTITAEPVDIIREYCRLYDPEATELIDFQQLTLEIQQLTGPLRAGFRTLLCDHRIQLVAIVTVYKPSKLELALAENPALEAEILGDR